MGISRSERHTIYICALIILVGILSVVFSKSYEVHRQEINEIEKQSRNTHFGIGETAILDSKEDKEPLSTGDSYAADFGWNGVLKVKILDSRLFKDWHKAKSFVNNDLDFLAPSEYLDTIPGVIVIEVELSNVDATYSSMLVNDPSCFNCGFLNISPRGEVIGVSDPPFDLIDSNETSRWYTRIAPGETKTIRIAYEVTNQKALSNKKFSLWAGSFNSQKYRFDLDVEPGD